MDLISPFMKSNSLNNSKKNQNIDNDIEKENQSFKRKRIKDVKDLQH